MIPKPDQPQEDSLTPEHETVSPTTATPFQKSWLWLCVLIGLAWIVATTLIMGGGFKHFEVDVYMPYHLSSAPLMQKLFNNRILDYYQARELSYLFDHLDCRVIAACMRIGVPHFMSTTMLLFIVALSLVVWRLCMRDLRLGLPVTSLMTLLYLTTPFSIFSTAYYRTSKIGVSLMTALAAITIYRFFNQDQPPTRKNQSLTCLWLFTLATLAMLFDRQGVFMTGLAMCVILLFAVCDHRRQRWILLLPLVLAFVFNVFYNHRIAPHLTWAFHGYWPNSQIQTLPLANILDRPLLFLIAGCGMAVETLSFTFGNLPYVYFFVGWCGIVWLLWNLSRHTLPAPAHSVLALVRSNAPICLLFGVAISFTLMNILMVCGHTPLVWPDVRRVYYWLPASTLWYILACMFVHMLQRHRLVSNRVLVASLFILVLGNITALPVHRAIINSGHLHSEIAFAPRLLSALRTPPAISNTLSPEITNDVAYQLFKCGKNRFDDPPKALAFTEQGPLRVELFELTTNLFPYAYHPLDGAPSAIRGSLVSADASCVRRCCLWRPMRLTAVDGTSYRFSTKQLHVTHGTLCFTRIRVMNKGNTTLSFKIGSFGLLANGSPMDLIATGVDKWLFAKLEPTDRQAARAQTVPIPGNSSREFVYAFTSDSNSPTIEMNLAQ